MFETGEFLRSLRNKAAQRQVAFCEVWRPALMTISPDERTAAVAAWSRRAGGAVNVRGGFMHSADSPAGAPDVASKWFHTQSARLQWLVFRQSADVANASE